jgi:hypothetical protein
MIESNSRPKPIVLKLEHQLNEIINEIFIYENSEEERELFYLLGTNVVLRVNKQN